MFYKKILVFFPIVGFIVLTAWLLHSSKEMTKKQNNEYGSPDTIMTDITVIQLDKFGKVHTNLTSKKVFEYQAQKHAKFVQPFYTIYNKNRAPWHISSNLANTFNDADKIILSGNVIAEELSGTQNFGTTLLTTQITIFPNKEYAITKKPVTIKQPSNTIDAIGLKVNLKTGKIKLLSETKGIYH